MLGPEKDVPGECNARLIVGDDYGDNTTTFRCQRPGGHHKRSGTYHKETFRNGNVTVLWEGDDREKCPRCQKRVMELVDYNLREYLADETRETPLVSYCAECVEKVMKKDIDEIKDMLLELLDQARDDLPNTVLTLAAGEVLAVRPWRVDDDNYEPPTPNEETHIEWIRRLVTDLVLSGGAHSNTADELLSLVLSHVSLVLDFDPDRPFEDEEVEVELERA